MTRQGSKYKMVSSGRLTGLGRGQAARKRVPGRGSQLSAEPAYSLYSTDSEEPVATIHKGLDRCAALLDGILQAETTEANSSSARVMKAGLNQASGTLSILGKQRGDTERRKLTKKVKKPVPAPVQKTILSFRVNPGEKNNDPIRSSRPGTRFNCRLTTSTPTLSPERLLSDGTGTRGNRPPSVPPGQHRDQVHKGAPVLQGNPELSASRNTPAVSTAPSLCVAQPGCRASEVGPPAAPGAVGLGGAPCLGRPTQSTTPTSSCDSEVGKSCSLASGCRQFQPHSQAKVPPPPVPSSGAPPPLEALSQPQQPPHPGSCWACGLGTSAAPPGRTDEEEAEDIVPTRDTSAQTSFVTPAPAAYTIAKPHTPLGSEPTQSAETHPEPPHPTHTPCPLLSSEACKPEELAGKVMTVQYLLGELKARLAGQDGAAERLLSDLEQTVCLLPVVVGSTNVQAEIALVLQPLRSENAQLRRRLRILNHQLQERERAEREARSLLCDSDMMTLQGELSDAQARIQELHHDNVQLRKALQDTQSQLQNSKAKNDYVSKEDHERQVEECRREQAAVALVAQQRQTEVERLHTLLRAVQGPVMEPPAPNTRPSSQLGLTRRALDEHQDQQGSSGRGSDTVSLYLKSLDQKGPSSPPCKGPSQSAEQDLSVCVDQSWGVGEEGENKLAQWESVRSALPVVMSQKGGGAPAEAFTTGHRSLDGLLKKAFNQLKEAPSRLNQSNDLLPGVFPGGQQGPENPSECQFSVLSSDVQSLRSDSSVLSSSTFDTRDELEFRNGLAALDASIASLQKTIQQDLRK